MMDLLPLWEQKGGWNVMQLVLNLEGSEFAYPFALYERERRVGALLMIHDRIYDALVIDTLVLDRAVRSLNLLRRAVATAAPLSIALGKKLGVKKIRCTMRGARRVLKWWPDARIVSETLGRNL